jgi:hypothetical protein
MSAGTAYSHHRYNVSDRGRLRMAAYRDRHRDRIRARQTTPQYNLQRRVRARGVATERDLAKLSELKALLASWGVQYDALRRHPD